MLDKTDQKKQAQGDNDKNTLYKENCPMGRYLFQRASWKTDNQGKNSTMNASYFAIKKLKGLSDRSKV
jgi:hypothetical protein